MPIRKLLLPLTGTTAGEAAIATALLVARQFNAHILALHVRADSRDVAPLAGEGLSGAMIQEMMQATEKESGERSSAVRELFDRALGGAGIRMEHPTAQEDHPSASFTTTIGREEDVVAQQARLADLTVVPHPESGDDVSSSDALHAVLFDSGPSGVDRAAPQSANAGQARGIGVEWNGGGCRLRPGRAAMAAQRRRRAHPVLRRVPTERSLSPRACHLSRSARGPGRAGKFPARSTARSAPGCWRPRASSAPIS